MAYTCNDIALIIPTKDRPGKIRNILESLVLQEESPGRIVIVDGGKPVEHIVTQFSEALPVEYYTCSPPSLIRQRNLGISRLRDSTPLVGFIDDDVVFEAGAFSEMIRFWNETSENAAAVSFNIVNVPKSGCNLLHSLFFLSDARPGRVLKSGVTTTYHNFDRNLKTQWVCGGATVWRLEVIREFPVQEEINSRWAVCEDLIYSYPIGKKYDFFLCSAARVRHEHDNDYQDRESVYGYIGYNEILWRLYFVKQHSDLSTWAWFLYALGRCGHNLWHYLSQKNKDYLKKAAGNLSGLCLGLSAMTFGMDLRGLLDEDPAH